MDHHVTFSARPNAEGQLTIVSSATPPSASGTSTPQSQDAVLKFPDIVPSLLNCICRFVLELRRCHRGSAEQRCRSRCWCEREVSGIEHTCAIEKTVESITNYIVLFRLNPTSPLAKTISLGSTDTLKLLLTATEGNKPKRPHQAFLTLSDPVSGVEESFVFTVKDNGKGKVELVIQPPRHT